MQYVCMVPQCKGDMHKQAPAGPVASRGQSCVLLPCCCRFVPLRTQRGRSCKTRPHRLESSFQFYQGTVFMSCIRHGTLGAASREVQFKSLRSLNDYCLLVLLHVSYIATAQPTTIIRMCVCESTSFTPVQCTLVGQFPSCNKDGCSFKCCQVEEPF